ncbi:MAG TPA: PHP domain-containing protein [Gammaproteobacteria bacterium]|nr:putative hydrolase [bacterium BMS3Abin11]HDH16258.1 PHP domain-containing protein [Gammaproteobacteria bacterium]
MHISSRINTIFPWSAILAVLLLAGCSPPQDAEVITEIPWALISRPLVMDTHTHTNFSDGSYSVEEVTQLAIDHGCEALAITDHSDLSEGAATPGYFSSVDAARKKHPGFILFGGIEWNIPPYEGREHVTVLLDPMLEATLLGTFKQQFEQDTATAARGLQWLANKTGIADRAVLIYNHPARKDDDLDENIQDILRWRESNLQFIGFEGAPGHQRKIPTGSYRGRFQTQDRWDPVTAEIGGVWDQLLDRGNNIWAALASSDFHNKDTDYAPCEFARIHVYPEDRTARGILAGLRAGSFWADHGRILDDLLFTLSVPGLSLPVTPGEVIRLRAGQPLQFTVLLQRGTGALESGLIVELIGNGRSGKPELLFTKYLPPDQSRVDWTLAELVAGSDGTSAYFRVRIRKPVNDGADLMAYTNAIRIVTH